MSSFNRCIGALDARRPTPAAPGRQILAARRRSIAGRHASSCLRLRDNGALNRRRRRPCWCRGNRSRVTHHSCHLGSVVAPQTRVSGSSQRGGTSRRAALLHLSTARAPSRDRPTRLLQQRQTRSAAPCWPAPESRHRLAAGSARASGPPSRPRSPRREFGCATPRGSR